MNDSLDERTYQEAIPRTEQALAIVVFVICDTEDDLRYSVSVIHSLWEAEGG